MDCQETQQHVHEYLHNSLSEAEAQEITAHIANCDHCEAHYDVENLVNKVIQEACANDEPPAQVVDRILSHIRAIEAGEKH
jgi:anti-sigma factor (TIGR02949 family)